MKSNAWLASILVLTCSGCTVINDVDACEAPATEVRVNQRADLNDALGNSRAATALTGGLTLVAYNAVDLEGTVGEVRIVILNRNGTRVSLCDSGDFETTLSAAGVFASDPMAVAVEEDLDGRVAVAAVGWTENAQGQRSVKVRFVDIAGCPLGRDALSPALGLGAGSDPIQVGALALAWSDVHGELLTLFHDGHVLYRRWYDGLAATSARPIAQAALLGRIAVALRSDGTGLVVYAGYVDGNAISSGRVDVSTLVLDDDGLPTQGGSGPRPPRTIDWGVEVVAPSQVAVDVAVASDRYGVITDLAAADDAPWSVRMIELSPNDGRPLGRARAVAPEVAYSHFNPTISYMPDDSVLVTWQSAAALGTVARLLDPELAPRFNSVSCDEGPFPVGARTHGNVVGLASVVVHEGRVNIVHAAEVPYDSVGTGVVSWSMPWSSLWPQRAGH